MSAYRVTVVMPDQSEYVTAQWPLDFHDRVRSGAIQDSYIEHSCLVEYAKNVRNILHASGVKVGAIEIQS